MRYGPSSRRIKRLFYGLILAVGIFHCISCTNRFGSISTNEITGMVSAGPVDNATVTAYSLKSDGSQGAPLATGASDSSGKFALGIPAESGPIIIIASGGTYTEEASGETVHLGNAQIRTVLPSTTKGQEVGVTPVSEIATQYALAAISANSSVSVQDVINFSNAKVSSAMGISDITRPPADPTQPAKNAGSAEAAKYAVLLATISQVAKTATTNLGSTINSLDMAQALATSFAYNGSFSGTVGSGGNAQDVPVPNSADASIDLDTVLAAAGGLGATFTTAMQSAMSDYVASPQAAHLGFNNSEIAPPPNFVTTPAAPSGLPALTLPPPPSNLPSVRPSVGGPPPWPISVPRTSPPPGCYSSGASGEMNPNCTSPSPTTNPTPTPAPSPSGSLDWTDALAQGSLSNNPCAISKGQVKCWGENTYGQLGLGSLVNIGDNANEMGLNLATVNLGTNLSVTEVAVTNGASRCALFSNGKIKCWGANGRGVLGYGDLNDRISLSDLGDNLPYVDLGINVIASHIYAGNQTYCAITSTGQVKCWGAFTFYTYFAQNPGFVGDKPGQMGDNLPFVNLPPGRTAVKLSMNNAGNCALLDDGTLYCWGHVCYPTSSTYEGPNFTCSDEARGGIPYGVIPLGSAVKDIAVGSLHACAILTSGNVKCWGTNDDGQLGQGDTVYRGVNNAHINDIANIPPVNLGTGRTAVKISAGQFQTCAILDNGQLKCWGYNLYGELGLEDTIVRGDSPNEMGDNLPAVSLGTGRTAIDISAQVIQTCALLDNHTVKCWGYNPDGRLGQGDTNSRGTLPGTMGDALLPISLWK